MKTVIKETRGRKKSFQGDCKILTAIFARYMDGKPSGTTVFKYSMDRETVVDVPLLRAHKQMLLEPLP